MLEELQSTELSELYREVFSLPGGSDWVSFMIPLITVISITITVAVIVVIMLPFLRYLIYTKFCTKFFFFFFFLHSGNNSM